MQEYSIIRMGHPVLQQVAVPVQDVRAQELLVLIQTLQAAMAQHQGVGIAAPQIGVSLRVMVFGFTTNARYPNEQAVPETVLINPEVEFLSEELQEGWEGCLSVPGLRGLVPRYTHIRYSGYDVQGQHFSRTASGFHARIVQHELDHLNGILYPQRINNLRHFGFESELPQHKPVSVDRKSSSV